MEIRDNRLGIHLRDKYLERRFIIKGKIVNIYRWGDGVTITLDTGYDIILEKNEIGQIMEPLSKD